MTLHTPHRDSVGGADASRRMNKRPDVPFSIYDGRDLIGTVQSQGAGFDAFDARGNRLGHYRSRKAAVAAVNTSLPCSCVCDANARRDNSE